MKKNIGTDFLLENLKIDIHKKQGDCHKNSGVVAEALPPETKMGVAGGKASGIVRGTKTDGVFVQEPAFVTDTAKKIGKSETFLINPFKNTLTHKYPLFHTFYGVLNNLPIKKHFYS